MLIRSQTQPRGKGDRVDAGTALSQFLSHVYVPGIDRGGSTFAFDRKGSANLLTVTGTSSVGYGNAGQFYVDTNTGYVSGPITTIASYPLVLVVAGYFANGSDGWILAGLNTSGGAGSSNCSIVFASSTEIDYVIRNNFGTVATTQATGLTGVGTIGSNTLLVCVAQSLSASDHRFYVNGTQYTSTTNMGGITNGYNALVIGGGGTGAAPFAKLNGGVLFAGVGSRKALPDSLALDVSRSPLPFWNMFARQGRRYMAMAPAAAAGGFKARYYYDMTSGAANV